MDRDFALSQKISLNTLPCPASVVVIDGRPIASGHITEETEPLRIVLDNLACIISFNISSSPEHPIVLGLPWFELHNPSIDWRRCTIQCPSQEGFQNGHVQEACHQISTVSTQPFKDPKGNPKIELPHKYEAFIDVFDKDKANILPEHRLYDVPLIFSQAKGTMGANL
jgi:hypothetical protein